MTVAALWVGGTAAQAAPVPSTGAASGGEAVTVPEPTPAFTQVMSTIASSVALDETGVAWTWGGAGQGQLGDGSTAARSMPQPVAMPVGVSFTQLSGSNGHYVALGDDGGLYSWGANGDGQLGDGTTTDRPAPVPVAAPAGLTFTAVASGSRHSMAIGSDGKTYAWGSNIRGQLGDGTTNASPTPVPVAAPAGVSFTQISVGAFHSLALGDDGRAYAWGENPDGRLGDGTTVFMRLSPVPVVVPAGVSFTQLSAGRLHSVGLASDGALYAWGKNSNGRLGDGTAVDRSAPVPVLAASGAPFQQVEAGDDPTLALGADGVASAWGANASGQIGDGTSVDRPLPVRVAAPAGEVLTQVSASTSSNVVLGQSGKMFAWGANQNGRLGDGTVDNRTAPVPVLLDAAASSISFDGVPGSGLTDNGDGTWSAVSPAHAPGPVDVEVAWTLNGAARPPVVYPGGFTYAEPEVAPQVTDPVDQLAGPGENAVFTVTASGAPAPAVSWEFSTDGGGTWQAAAGEPGMADSGATLTVAASEDRDGSRYRAVATNAAGTVRSLPAVLTVTAALVPSIAEPPIVEPPVVLPPVVLPPGVAPTRVDPVVRPRAEKPADAQRERREPEAEEEPAEADPDPVVDVAPGAPVEPGPREPVVTTSVSSSSSPSSLYAVFGALLVLGSTGLFAANRLAARRLLHLG